MTWEPVEGDDIASYLIQYRMKLDQSEWKNVTVDSTVTSYEITGLLALITYEVRIFAISSENVRSEEAEAISVTTTGIAAYLLVF